MTESHLCAPLSAPADWDGIRLVVFDVDGTLYRQRPLRLRMARDLLLHSLTKRDLNVISVLRNYRRIRERLADRQAADFEPALIAETAAATANTPNAVRAIATEWLERRPLPISRQLSLSRIAPIVRRPAAQGKDHRRAFGLPGGGEARRFGTDRGSCCNRRRRERWLSQTASARPESLIVAAGVNANATVLIGDRADRDGVAARRAGARRLDQVFAAHRGLANLRRFRRCRVRTVLRGLIRDP